MKKSRHEIDKKAGSFRHKPQQLLFKRRKIIYARAIYVFFAKRLVFVRRNVSHSRYRPPRNLAMFILPFRRKRLYQLANIDKRHADGARCALVAKKRFFRYPCQHFSRYGNFSEYLSAYLPVARVHSTRTTFPGRIMLFSGSGA